MRVAAVLFLAAFWQLWAQTVVSLTPSPNPSIYGQPVTLTATVTPPPASGLVTFYAGTTVLGSATLSAGQAVLQTILLPAGSNSLRAYCQGFASAVVIQTVNGTPGSTFAAAGSSPFMVGSGPISMALADFNGDGKADLAIANSGDNTVTVLLGDGNGGFAPATGSPFAAGNSPVYVSAGDFNEDGKADLALAGSGNNTVTVLLGNGNGGFTPAMGSPFAAGNGPVSLAVGDFNEDGKPDLAIADTNAGAVTVLLGDGTGAFTLAAGGSPFTVGTSPNSIAVGDFNGDGKADLAVTNGGSNNVTVLLGNGNGGFTAAAGSPISVTTAPAFVAIGDFNGDGKADLAIAKVGQNALTVLLGNGSGGFTAGPYFQIYWDTAPTSIAVADFNGDGIQDVALSVALSGGTYQTVLLGTGSGSFSQEPLPAISTGTDPKFVVVGDFSGDGIQDLAVANFTDNDVTVLLGQPRVASTTSLAASLSPSTYGQPVTLTATITPEPSDVLPFTVTFMDGSTVLGMSTGAGSTALLYVSTLAAGSHSLTAVFMGSVNDAPGTSTPVTQTVNIATPALTLDSSANPSAFGQSVTLIAGISPSIATGIVTFKDGSTTLGTGMLSGGVATLTLSTLAAGAHSLSAAYAGDANDVAAASPAINQIVDQPGTATAITLTSSLNPSTLGQSVTLTATVSPAAATGNVTFYDGTAVLGPAVVTGGQASLTTKLPGAGAHSLTAYFGVGAAYGASVSANLPQTVNALPANGFLPPVNYNVVNYTASFLSVPDLPTAVAQADFNGDGKTDLVVAAAVNTAIGIGPAAVSVFLGNGDGTFQTAAPFAVAANPGAVAVGDFNGDGKPDLAVADSAGVNVLLGNGDGTFQAALTYAAGSPSAAISIAVGDFNRDGKADLVIANGIDSDVRVLLGNGDGTFQAALQYTFPTGGVYPESVASGDFNRDGKTDIAVNDAGGVSVFLGNGDGTFQTAVNYATANSSTSVAVGDFNGDGKPDLAAAVYDGTVSVFLGNGDGTFQTALSYGAGSYPESIAVGDVNGDGKEDLIVANNFVTDSVGVLLGNGDGTEGELKTV